MPCLCTSRVPTRGTARKRQRTQQPRDNKKPKQSRATMHVSLAFFLSKMIAILERTLIKKYTTKGLFRVENKKGGSSGVASLKKDGNTVGISSGKAEVFYSHFLSVLTKDQVTSSTHEYPRCPNIRVGRNFFKASNLIRTRRNILTITQEDGITHRTSFDTHLPDFT